MFQCGCILSQHDLKVLTQYMNYKQKIEASNRRLINLGNEYARSKDDAICRQKLNLMFRELSAQMVCLSEQNIELMRKLEKYK
mgnify:CR=1 FL=1